MTPSVTLTLPLDHPKLGAILHLAGVSLPTQPISGARPQTGSTMDPTGLAILDDAGAATVADPRNATPRYLDGLRLLASKEDVTEAELMKAVGGVPAFKLSGHKAATTKRVQTALGGKTGAVLFRIEGDKVVIAPETRGALARHFGLTS
jgi:hypothetical protein